MTKSWINAVFRMAASNDAARKICLHVLHEQKRRRVLTSSEFGTLKEYIETKCKKGD